MFVRSNLLESSFLNYKHTKCHHHSWLTHKQNYNHLNNLEKAVTNICDAKYFYRFSFWFAKWCWDGEQVQHPLNENQKQIRRRPWNFRWDLVIGRRGLSTYFLQVWEKEKSFLFRIHIPPWPLAMYQLPKGDKRSKCKVDYR